MLFLFRLTGLFALIFLLGTGGPASAFITDDQAQLDRLIGSQRYDGYADCGVLGATRDLCRTIHLNECRGAIYSSAYLMANQERVFHLSREGLERYAASLAFSPVGGGEHPAILIALADQISAGDTPEAVRDRCIKYYSSPHPAR